MNAKLFRNLPLWLRIFLLVYMLLTSVMLFFSYNMISLLADHALDQEYQAALDEHAMLANALKMSSSSITDELGDSPELEYEMLSRFIENYGKYYADQNNAIHIANRSGDTIFTSIPADYEERMALEPPTDGRRSYVLRHIGERTVIFVSGCIELGHFLFRLDYAADITELMTSQHTLASRIAMLLAVGMLILAAGLFVLIRKSMSPIDELRKQTRAIAEGNYDRRATIRYGDEIGQLAVDFNRMADAVQRHTQILQEAIVERERFMASLAHELKTPLTSIMGYVSLLRNYHLDPEAFDNTVRSIDEASRRLDGISRKLLHLFRISGSYGIVKKKIAVQSIFREVKRISGYMLNRTSQQLHVEASVDDVYVDEELLLLLLNNLLENASKASRHGANISLKVYEEGGSVVFRVKDHGSGISQEHLQLVFQPFYMVDVSRSKEGNGSGLGLSLCKAIAEAHGGTIEIESEPGQGTDVYVRIPAAS